MCTIVIVGSKVLYSQKELRQRLHLPRLPKRGKCPDEKDRDCECLCGVDVAEAARQANFACEDDGTDFFLTPPSTPDPKYGRGRRPNREAKQ